MPAYQCNAHASANHPARSFTVHAPNELWALELACKRAGYRYGLDQYLTAREADQSTPALRVARIPVLTDRAA